MVFKDSFTAFVKAICSIGAFVIGFLLPKIFFGYPWSINVSFIALGFVLLGSALRFVVFWFHDYCEKKRFGWIICSVLVFVFFVATMIYRYNIPEKGFVLMGNARYGNPLLFVLSSLFGISAVLVLSVLLELFFKGKDKVFSFIGQNTLCFFAVQKPIIKLFSLLFVKIPLPIVIELLLTTVGVLVISSLICLFINKYLPVFVGKQPLLNAKH
jgi:hypothetical protein